MTPVITSARTTKGFRLFAAAVLAAAIVAASAPADVVILKDGFVIQGKVIKETELVIDKSTGGTYVLPRGNGFDLVDEGPKVMVFSTHFKQLGEINKDIKIRPEYKSYLVPLGIRKGNDPLPSIGGTIKAPDFNEKWRRTLEVRVPGGFDRIEQQVTYLDPYFCYIVSPTHSWRITYRTSEMEPAKVRKLLSTHPELSEPDGKPDPFKRIAIARFMKDVGWLQLAKDELDRLKKDVPVLAKDAQEALDKFNKELDNATAELVVKEADLALNAGRYQYASDLLATFPAKTADSKEVDKATKLMAQLKTTREQYDSGRRLLRSIIDDITGGASLRAAIGAGGGPVIAVWPRKQVADSRLLVLAEAAEHVYQELHPDSAGRIEFFVNLAAQAEREKMQGQQPSKKPEELLATAISGWAKGKNGATPLVDPALRLWAARETVLAFQRGTDRNARNAVLNRYRKANPLGMDELAQIISLLPPAEPENLSARTGELVPERDGAPPGTYQRKTGPTVDHPSGVDYLIKLPPEYHHGRAYPVLIAMTHPQLDAEDMMRALARETDRNGYILVAPEWAHLFGKGWQWKGEDHDYVTGVLRDVIRHFTVDNDRVFLFGAGEGANAAMDVGISHPDLFAGVLAMGPTPKWQGMFLNYWQNAQKLPVYAVTGELAGASYQNLRYLFEKWMPKGFPSVMSVYKGRGIEWYSAETPVMFDWMNRKKRATPAAVLNLGVTNFEWQMMRPGDNRFYWLGADKINERNLIDPANPNRPVTPAGLMGDLRGNNSIDIRSRGVRTVTVWLNRDMIDWTQPVKVTLDGTVPIGWKSKVLEPSLDVLLDDYYERGDRRMLYLYKLEFPSRN